MLDRCPYGHTAEPALGFRHECQGHGEHIPINWHPGTPDRVFLSKGVDHYINRTAEVACCEDGIWRPVWNGEPHHPAAVDLAAKLNAVEQVSAELPAAVKAAIGAV